MNFSLKEKQESDERGSYDELVVVERGRGGRWGRPRLRKGGTKDFLKL